MKKSAVFLLLSLSALGFFACDFTLEPPNPTAIEIKGTPSIRFAETVEIGKMFTGLLDDALSGDDKYDKMSIIHCNQTEYLTYIIHMDLFNTDFEAIEQADDINNLVSNFPGMDLLPEHIGITLTEDKVLIDGTNDRMNLPLSEIGSVLNGFEFSDFKTKLYISGSPLIGKAKIDIIIEEVEGDNYTRKNDNEKIAIVNKGSSIEDWKAANNEYTGKDCPAGGVEIDIPIKGKDIAVSFKVYIPEGETLYLEDFEAGNIKVEAVIWLPFVFTAGDNGAEIAFPKDSFFDPDNDLFGRENAGDNNIITDFVESMSVSIKFDRELFKGADLIVESTGGLEFHNPVTNNTLSFSVSEEDMKKINNPDYFPFAPNLKINFGAGKKIGFPREFNATEFGIKAKIQYRIDLQSDDEEIK